MSARLFACLVATFCGVAFATPSSAETFVVNGALVENVDGLDRTILDYGEIYPPPSPTHAMMRSHYFHRAQARWRAPVFYDDHPCLLSDGQAAVVVSCRWVPHLVGDPLP